MFISSNVKIADEESHWIIGRKAEKKAAGWLLHGGIVPSHIDFIDEGIRQQAPASQSLIPYLQGNN